MNAKRDSSLFSSFAQVFGMLLMIVASAYWVVVDYPGMLPKAVVTAVPDLHISSTWNWILIFAVSGIGWGIYQWGVVLKARQPGRSGAR